MIVGSLLLILVAVVLLAAGLVGGSSGLLIASIGASLLAAVALVVGARQAATARATADPAGPARPGDRRREPAATAMTTGSRRSAGQTIPAQFAPKPDDTDDSGWRQPPGSPVTGPAPSTEPAPPVAGAEPSTEPGSPAAEPEPSTRSGSPVVAADEAAPVGTDPPRDEPAPVDDEPDVQEVSPADAARVARLDTEVLVVDGRPRYHVPDCLHLLGRETEPLPASEAVELGFTPCADCTPDTVLLADSRSS